MLYENIESLCKKNGITIHGLEMTSGIPNGTVWKWKDRNANPRVETVYKIAKVLGTTVEKLME